MDKNTQLIKELFRKQFPLLAGDNNFEISSPKTPDYNCLAWALHFDNRWMQPPSITLPPMDSVYYWPEGALQGTSIDCLVDAYRKKGFVICDNPDFEKEYQKIALYFHPENGDWTHAARQLRNGFWTSKMGSSHDIQHSSPYVLEGAIYGKVYCIMRRPFN